MSRFACLLHMCMRMHKYVAEVLTIVNQLRVEKKK